MTAPSATSFGSSSSAGSGTYNFPVTIASGVTLLMVGLSIGCTAANPFSVFTSLVWNTSETIAQVSGSQTDDNNFEGVAWYSLVNPTPGSFNVGVTFNAAYQVGVTVAQFTDASLVIETPSITAEGGSASANPSLTVVDTASGNCVLAILANDSQDDITGQSGTDIGNAFVATDSHFAGQYTTASGANTVMSWTEGSTGASWVISGVAISGPAGGGGNVLMGQVCT